MKQSRYCLAECNYKAISVIVKLLQGAGTCIGTDIDFETVNAVSHIARM